MARYAFTMCPSCGGSVSEDAYGTPLTPLNCAHCDVGIAADDLLEDIMSATPEQLRESEELRRRMDVCEF